MSKPLKKGNPFSNIFELIESLFQTHVDNSKIDQILETSKANAADLLSIKVYLGITDPPPLSTEDQNALDDVRESTLRLLQKAEAISTTPPTPEPERNENS